MITTAVGYLAYIFGISALIFYIAKKYPSKIFNYVPPIVIIYIVTIILYSLGLWQMTDEVNGAKNFVTNNLVPAMVFLMCLNCNLKKILKLGPKLLVIFLTGSLTVTIGFVVAFVLLGRGLDYSPEIFASVNGAYVGAGQNFLALSRALNVPDAGQGNMLLMVNIPYALWIILLIILGTKANADKFNAWTGADTEPIYEVSRNLDAGVAGKRYFNSLDITIIAAVTFAAIYVCRLLAGITPVIGYINESVWEFVYVTVLGLILAFTPLGNLKGNDEISSFLISITMAVAASSCSVRNLASAWQFILAGFIALLVHGFIFVLFAKLFHWDLHSIETASIANVGGPSSAPVVAGTFHKAYVSISVLMSAVGCIIGTFVGLAIYKVFVVL